MSRIIAASQNPIILLGAGQASPEEVTNALPHAEKVVACDGGAHLALEAGILPDAVVGDFDSLSADMAAQIPSSRLHKVEDQDRTDFQKGLASVEAPLILAIGFMGGRLDHQLAAMTALLGDPRPVLLLTQTDVACLCPKALDLPRPVGSAFALYPLMDVHVKTQGLKWDVDGALSPRGLISTSNRVEASPVRIETSARHVLLVAPRAALPGLIAALST